MSDIVNVSGLNLEQIKTSIKNYLKSQPEFLDYDFEGSVISTLLNVLAYNTYYNSYYINMISNEAYLDTALIRENVISNAKKIGYVPKSAKSAVASLFLTFNPPDYPDEIVIPKYSKFTASLDGVNYNLVTIKDYSVTSNETVYSASVTVVEGYSYTYSFVYYGQKFLTIPDSNIDVDYIRVFVQQNETVTDRNEYFRVNDLTQIKSDSLAYFIQEGRAGKWEIYFGDGILGKKLILGNVIKVEALVTSGSVVNGIRSISAGAIAYNKSNVASTYTPLITMLSDLNGGEEIEDIERIRFSAPRQFSMQNRTVTATDYRNYILTNYADVESISSWGGEDNDPPAYGKVILSLKPKRGFVFSTVRKDKILTNIRSQNVLAIDPIIVDPSFTFVNINSTVYYNSNNTTLSETDIFTKISTAIQLYENTNLSVFNKSFHKSKFQTLIDSIDSSIVSNTTTFTLEKRFVPFFFSTFNYSVNYSSELFHPYDGYLGTLSSSGFKLSNLDQSRKYFLDDDGRGKLRIFYTLEAEKIYVNSDVGTIDYSGKINLINFNFSEIVGDEFKLYVSVITDTYIPTKNEILLLSFPKITVFDIKRNSNVLTSTVNVEGDLSPIKTNSILNTVIV